MKRAPWVHEHAEAVLTYNRLAEQFGLTPMARTRLGHAGVAAPVLTLSLDPPIVGPLWRGPVEAVMLEPVEAVV